MKSSSDLISRLDEDGVDTIDVITEAGLYEVGLYEVLPSIRKHQD